MEFESISLDDNDPIFEKLKNQKFSDFVKEYGTTEFILISVGTLGISSIFSYYRYKNRIKKYEKRKELLKKVKN